MTFFNTLDQQKQLNKNWNQLNWFSSPSPVWEFNQQDSYCFQEDKELMQEQAEFQNMFEQNLSDVGLFMFPESPVSSKKMLEQQDNLFAFQEEQVSFVMQSPVAEVPKIQQKIKSIEKKKFHDKNCCKYILLNALRTLENSIYFSQVAVICDKYQVDSVQFRGYYSKAKNQLTGFSSLKKELIIKNGEESTQRKMAFKEYLVWYLDNLATSHIFSSKTDKKNLSLYLRYKNRVMSYYVNYPEQWFNNYPPSFLRH